MIQSKLMLTILVFFNGDYLNLVYLSLIAQRLGFEWSLFSTMRCFVWVKITTSKDSVLIRYFLRARNF